jgi:hypothetical protein
MPTSTAQLIQRLQIRNADRAIATDGGMHPRKAVPCVTKQNLIATEKALKFKLPELVRSLYLEVGNGGFGPQYGIVGTHGGAKLDGCTLETCYQQMLELANDCSVWRWPPMLLPLANLGCGMWSCVDCSYARLPMILWDPNNLDDELETGDAEQNWGNSFWDQGLSLNKWLVGWLDGADEPEPKWPTPAWTKKRLGISMNP